MQARHMKGPTVHIVLPVHNRRAVTGAFCDCLARQTYSNFVLILVDDGSTDGTAELVAGYPFRKHICRGDGKLWWAGGLRRGMARLASLRPALDDVVLLVNDDTSFGDDFLQKAVEEIDRIGDPAMLSVQVLFRDSGRKAEGGFVCDWPHFTFRDYGRHPEKIDCASTRCLFVCYGDLMRCGRFRPGLLPHYLSDLEFTIRARRRGVRILPAKNLVCYSTEYSTGMHRLPTGGFTSVLRYILSPRFSANPVHVFMFILLAAPPLWKPLCWLRASYSASVFFLKATILNRLCAHD